MEAGAIQAGDPRERHVDDTPGTNVDPPVIELEGLRKVFRRSDGTEVPAVDDVSLRVRSGQFVVLLGPSGCGKTTLLRCIAGLETPDQGVIRLEGRTVHSDRRSLPPEKRNLGMVFQSYALWPHRTVFENVAYPLQSKRLGRDEIQERVRSVLSKVGIPELEDQHPGKLSGGQQQRVALARAFVSGSNVLLFDEPLSNVDAKIRERLRIELLRLQNELGFTAVYVTHDQQEAMSMADEIAVLNAGRIEQQGAPETIYHQPATRYVADFIGTTNSMKGELIDHRSPYRLSTPIGDIELPATASRPPESFDVVTRPEHWHIARREPDSSSWAGTVTRVTFLGPAVEYHVAVGEVVIRVWESDTTPHEVGETITVAIAPSHLLLLS